MEANEKCNIPYGSGLLQEGEKKGSDQTRLEFVLRILKDGAKSKVKFYLCAEITLNSCGVLMPQHQALY